MPLPFVSFGPAESSPAVSPALRLRAMGADDVPAVLAIQAACYGAQTVEPEAVIRRRLAVAPETAWVAEAATGVCAYLVGYRSSRGRLTPLHGDFEPQPAGDCLYLHDLAVAAAAAGAGAARALIERAWAHARALGLTHSALVSVQDSRAFWQKRGYAVVAELSPEQRRLLSTYPGPSDYMARALEI